MSEVFAFECSVVGTEWVQVVNACTSGQAKAEYWRDVRDAWSSIPYTAVRAKKLGAPRDTLRLTECCRYRGVSLKAGDRVCVGESSGTVVDGASGANFLILFDSGRFKGCRLAVHPSEIAEVPHV